MVSVTSEGLFCKAGHFWIDPWRATPLAVITHAHSDHARTGMQLYVATPQTAALMRVRYGDLPIQEVSYGEKIRLGEAWVSFHSAGHILGSAQLRIEGKSDAGIETVWVVSGDYKRQADLSCDPFEVVPCDVFISEATFGLPVYHWEETAAVVGQMIEWVEASQHPSIVFGYSLGKIQRILAELGKAAIGFPIFLHGAASGLTTVYETFGTAFAPYKLLAEATKKNSEGLGTGLILAPPAAGRADWIKKFPKAQTAFASGWMQIRAAKKQAGYDVGFALSDHADWNGLVTTIRETGARMVYVTHGKTDVLTRYLFETYQIEAQPLKTLFEGDNE